MKKIELSSSDKEQLFRDVMDVMSNMFQYYGIDWLAMIFTFFAIYLIGNKTKAGFPIMMCGNSCWIAVGVMTSSVAMIFANIVFLLMNVRALVKWGQS